MKPQNYKVADNRHDIGILWIPSTLQWLLAYIVSFCPEDIPAAIYQIGLSSTLPDLLPSNVTPPPFAAAPNFRLQFSPPLFHEP
ncbi:hypothetical protein SOVF_205630 isoform A [Spinacia oleracea]|nr:hypothetical protein SOVF_205630 isoform A [Spinacia oleracea]